MAVTFVRGLISGGAQKAAAMAKGALETAIAVGAAPYLWRQNSAKLEALAFHSNALKPHLEQLQRNIPTSLLGKVIARVNPVQDPQALQSATQLHQAYRMPGNPALSQQIRAKLLEIRTLVDQIRASKLIAPDLVRAMNDLDGDLPKPGQLAAPKSCCERFFKNRGVQCIGGGAAFIGAAYVAPVFTTAVAITVVASYVAYKYQNPTPTQNAQNQVVAPVVVNFDGIDFRSNREITLSPTALSKIENSPMKFEPRNREGVESTLPVIIQTLSISSHLMEELPKRIQELIKFEGNLFLNGAKGVGKKTQEENPQCSQAKREALRDIGTLFASGSFTLRSLREHLRTLTEGGLDDIRSLSEGNKTKIKQLCVLLELNKMLRAKSGTQIGSADLDAFHKALIHLDPKEAVRKGDPFVITKVCGKLIAPQSVMVLPDDNSTVDGTRLIIGKTAATKVTSKCPCDDTDSGYINDSECIAVIKWKKGEESVAPTLQVKQKGWLEASWINYTANTKTTEKGKNPLAFSEDHPAYFALWAVSPTKSEEE